MSITLGDTHRPLPEPDPMSDTIDTGDTVLHGPTGEMWTVAYVQGDRLAWCGWPEGEAILSDCTLVKKATPEQRAALLNELAGMRPTDSGRLDMRASYAKHALSVTPPTGAPGHGE